MIEEKVETKNSVGEMLVGVEALPQEKKDKYPVVILVHGLAYYKEEDGMFVALARYLAEIGIACYYFDFSGCGESEGDFIDATPTKLKNDLNSIIEFVKSRSTTDLDKIGIVAQSFGTTNTMSLAPKIKSLVLIGTLFNAKKVLEDFFKEGYHPNGISEKPRSDGRITRIKPEFWKDFGNYDFSSLLISMHYPILFIHGSADDTVPLSEMEEAYEAASEPKEKVIIDGADHGLEPKREEVYRIITDWFRRTLLQD